MSIRLNGSTSGYAEIDAPAVAGNNTLILPGGNGANGQVLSTNGSGTLSWVSPIESGALYYRLNADLAGANATGAQSVFGVGVTLAAGTVYQYQVCLVLTKSAGTTSHTLAFGFGGTATINNFLSNGVGYGNSGALPGSSINAVQNTFASNSVASQVITGAVTSATVTWYYQVSGTVSINAGGTFIPQYTLSAAPGGAYSTVVGSYIRFVPIGTAGSNSSQGTWS